MCICECVYVYIYVCMHVCTCVHVSVYDLDNTVTIHHRNLQRLATLMFKVKNQLCPLPIQELFSVQLPASI